MKILSVVAAAAALAMVIAACGDGQPPDHPVTSTPGSNSVALTSIDDFEDSGLMDRLPDDVIAIVRILLTEDTDGFIEAIGWQEIPCVSESAGSPSGPECSEAQAHGDPVDALRVTSVPGESEFVERGQVRDWLERTRLWGDPWGLCSAGQSADNQYQIEMRLLHGPDPTNAYGWLFIVDRGTIVSLTNYTRFPDEATGCIQS